MEPSNLKHVQVNRIGERRFEAINARGGRITFGEGEDADFAPVELLLTAVAGCSSIDIDYLTSRRAEPTSFTVSVSAEKLSDELGNHLGPIQVNFSITFPEGEDGDRAREALPRAAQRSHDRLCTVSRSLALGTPVQFELGTTG